MYFINFYGNFFLICINTYSSIWGYWYLLIYTFLYTNFLGYIIIPSVWFKFDPVVKVECLSSICLWFLSNVDDGIRVAMCVLEIVN